MPEARAGRAAPAAGAPNRDGAGAGAAALVRRPAAGAPNGDATGAVVPIAKGVGAVS